EVVVFASPSSVAHFCAVLGSERARQVLGKVVIACIGPTTARAVAELGLSAQIQPSESSVPALVEAICAHYRGPAQ
ncbi:MAG: uroporphyrinogen-III synthase, partial [Candidatus Latescibacteria bacterium]|nr:uroporphyrinogen-III synthase [Candidatus Latescibacterota bacterium]